LAFGSDVPKAEVAACASGTIFQAAVVCGQ
jgi:hypothetical protein